MEYVNEVLHLKKAGHFSITGFLDFKGWAHLGSNQGPLDYESSALTS